MLKSLAKVGLVLGLTAGGLSANEAFVVERSFDKSKKQRGDAFCDKAPLNLLNDYIKDHNLILDSDQITSQNNKIKKYKKGNYVLYVVSAESKSDCKRMIKPYKNAEISNKKTVIINNLMWEDTENTFEEYTHTEAKNYCNNLILEKYSDWRLPTIEELFPLTNYKNANPSLIRDFAYNYKYNDYWSSTKSADAKENEFWTLDGGKGRISTDKPTDKNEVRCVRDIKNVSKSAVVKEKVEVKKSDKNAQSIKNSVYKASLVNKSGSEFFGEKTYYYNYSDVKIENGKLHIHTKVEGLGEFDSEKEIEVELKYISDLLIRQTKFKGVKNSGMTDTTNDYVLEIMLFDKDYHTIKDIRNKTKFKSFSISLFANDLNKLKEIANVISKNVVSTDRYSYLYKNPKIEIHYGENFTKKVQKAHKFPILCQSRKYVKMVLSTMKVSKERYNKALEDGRCWMKKSNFSEMLIEENTEEKLILVKFKERKDDMYKYYWTEIAEVK